jgi:aminoglycoside 6'-N-acetyltransferase
MPDSLPVLRTERLVLRPIEPRDVEPLLAMVNDSEWWGREAAADDLTSDSFDFTIEIDGEPAGWLGIHEENEPDYRHAALDITLMPAFCDRGLGPEAMKAAIGWLVAERGHHRFTIDPAAHNARAIAAYEKVGFEVVGTLRKYERGRDGSWHDGLLMDLVVAPR